jgi:hypothetical protein
LLNPLLAWFSRIVKISLKTSKQQAIGSNPIRFTGPQRVSEVQRKEKKTICIHFEYKIMNGDNDAYNLKEGSTTYSVKKLENKYQVTKITPYQFGDPDAVSGYICRTVSSWMKCEGAGLEKLTGDDVMRIGKLIDNHEQITHA